MKKLFTIITVLAVTGLFNISLAQTDQGTIMLGGSSNMNLGFGSQKQKVDDSTTSDNVSTTSFNISPKAGYFFADGIAGGLTINYSLNSTKRTFSDNPNMDNRVNTNNTLLIGPFMRYYTEMGIFGEAQVAFGSSSSTTKVDGEETQTSKDQEPTGLFQWQVGAGYAAFVGDGENVAIEPMLLYQSRTASEDAGSNSSYDKRKDITSSFGLSVGISVFL